MKLKATFHIGMGKTGTSSIQAALSECSEVLLDGKSQYLGMWPTFINENFAGPKGLSRFIRASSDEKTQFALGFLKKCKDENSQSGVDHFIFSNESLFTNGQRLAPFFDTLISKMDVNFVAYIRSPESWLPSAYTQWGLRHKKHSGKIRSFQDVCGDDIINDYGCIKFWHETYGNMFKPR